MAPLLRAGHMHDAIAAGVAFWLGWGGGRGRRGDGRTSAQLLR